MAAAGLAGDGREGKHALPSVRMGFRDLELGMYSGGDPAELGMRIGGIRLVEDGRDPRVPAKG